MLLRSQDGIKCDYCGSIRKQDFIYYSIDFREMIATANTLPQTDYGSQAIFSVDLCAVCMDHTKQDVVKTYKPSRMLPGRRCPGGIFCDLSGEHLKGSFTFYHCLISKVSVQMSNATVTCAKCNTAAPNDSNPCVKCGSTELRRSAETSVEDRHLELSVAPSVFEQFKSRAVDNRSKKEDEQWSASSE